MQTVSATPSALATSDAALAFLDAVCAQLTRDGSVDAALDTLGSSLAAARRALPAEAWQAIVRTCRSHTLRDVLHQDPLTARAFAMSRGYQGDAELLDIIYSGRWNGDDVSPLGAAIFGYTIRCQAPSAVRERRRFLASQIDRCCEEIPGAAILSIACGHLRELEISRAIDTRAFGRFVALDRDPATLAFVAEQWGPRGVDARTASVEMFMSDEPVPERFDLIYAAGLYDYLDDQLAQYITARLFELLRPGGRLLIGNYTPDTRDAGYMEAYMGWELTYRDADAMQGLMARVPAASIAATGILRDETGAVIYLDARAAPSS